MVLLQWSFFLNFSEMVENLVEAFGQKLLSIWMSDNFYESFFWLVACYNIFSEVDLHSFAVFLEISLQRLRI